MEGVIQGIVDANGFANVPVAWLKQLIFEHKQLQEQVASLRAYLAAPAQRYAPNEPVTFLASPVAFTGGFNLAK